VLHQESETSTTISAGINLPKDPGLFPPTFGNLHTPLFWSIDQTHIETTSRTTPQEED